MQEKKSFKMIYKTCIIYFVFIKLQKLKVSAQNFLTYLILIFYLDRSKSPNMFYERTELQRRFANEWH